MDFQDPVESRPNNRSVIAGPINYFNNIVQINGVGLPFNNKMAKHSPEIQSSSFLKLLSDHSFLPIKVNRRQITVIAKPTTTTAADTTLSDNENTDDSTPLETTTTVEITTDDDEIVSTIPPTPSPTGPSTTDPPIETPSASTSSPTPLPTKDSSILVTLGTTRPTASTAIPTTPSTASTISPVGTTPDVVLGNPAHTHHPHRPHPKQCIPRQPPAPRIINIDDTADVPFDTSDLLDPEPIVVVLENPQENNVGIIPCDRDSSIVVPESNIMRAIGRKIPVDNNIIRILPENNDCIEEAEPFGSHRDGGCENTGVLSEEDGLNDDDNDDEVIAWNRYLANWLFFNSRFWFGD